MKGTFTLLLCLCFAFTNAQIHFTRNLSIPVDDGSPLELAWAGGLNFPLFSDIDLNNDGTPDLFVFDRSNDRILTFVNNGASGTHCWEYAPQYESHFPPVQGWVFLYDYNCDGKPDLFTPDFFNHGISQYMNTSQGGNVSFVLVDSTIKYVCNCPMHFSNVFASEFLVPDFNDIDGDGDMDILGQPVLCVGTFIYYKNMSMEHYGVCDSIDDYVLETSSWGKFALRSGSYTNVIVGSWNINCFQSGNDHSYELAKRDDTYANVHTIDIDGDGDKDVLIGDAQANNSLLVINGGDSSLAVMVSQDTLFPSYDLSVHLHSFTAHSYIDADNDGIKDLIVSQSEYENKHGTYFYKNNGTNAAPVLSFVENDFLQNEMIDAGESAAPVLFDYDGDGLLDLFIGNKNVTIDDSTFRAGVTLYRNSGTLSNPAFTFVTGDYAGLQSIIYSGQKHGQLFPAFGDLDGDNDADMILGTDEGELIFFLNTAGSGVPPIYSAPVFNYMQIDVGQASTPQLFDLDRDGLLDLIIGEKNGLLNYYKNLGTINLAFFSSTPTIDSLGGPGVTLHLQDSGAVDGYSVPFMFVQGGQTRLLASCMKGDVYLYDNIDGNIGGDFNFVDTVYSKIGGNRYGYNLSVSGGDLNNDSLVDMVLGLYGGGPQVFYQDNSNSIYTLNLPDMIRVYPNPANGKIIIKSGYNFGSAQITLSDLTGRRIRTDNFKGDYTSLDISNVAPGVYFLNISSGNLNTTKKIVVER